MPNVGVLMMSQSKRLQLELKQGLREYHITLSQWAILAALKRSTNAQTAAELAEKLVMDKPTVSGIVRRLEQKFWLQSTPKINDGRARELSLTSAGEALYSQCEGLADRIMSQFLSPLSLQQRQQLTSLLTQLEGENVHG